VTVAAAASPADEGKINCFVNELKERKQIKDNFPTFPTKDQSYDCATALEAEKAHAKESWTTETAETSHAFDRSLVKCVREKVTLEAYTDAFLLSLVFNSSLPVGNEFPREVADNLLKNIHTAENECVEAKYKIYVGYEQYKLAAMFDNIFDRVSGFQFNESAEFKYCIRKYLLDNNYLNATLGIILNRDNLDVSKVDCSGAKDQTAATILAESTLNNACYIKKVNDIKNVATIWIILILPEANITEEQKDQFRWQFIRSSLKFQEDECE